MNSDFRSQCDSSSRLTSPASPAWRVLSSPVARSSLGWRLTNLYYLSYVTSHIYIIYILTNLTNNMSPVIQKHKYKYTCLQVDNRGNRLIVTDDSDINTPAVAAAYAIKRYSKQAQDEISFEVRKCLVGRI